METGANSTSETDVQPANAQAAAAATFSDQKPIDISRASRECFESESGRFAPVQCANHVRISDDATTTSSHCLSASDCAVGPEAAAAGAADLSALNTDMPLTNGLDGGGGFAALHATTPQSPPLMPVDSVTTRPFQCGDTAAVSVSVGADDDEPHERETQTLIGDQVAATATPPAPAKNAHDQHQHSHPTVSLPSDFLEISIASATAGRPRSGIQHNNSNSSTDQLSEETSPTTTGTTTASTISATAIIDSTGVVATTATSSSAAPSSTAPTFLAGGKSLNEVTTDDDTNADDEHAEDIKPLLSAAPLATSVAGAAVGGDSNGKLQQQPSRKMPPRSIVKSPSSRSFGPGGPTDATDASAAAGATAEPRPRLHVKFHHQNGGLPGTAGASLGDSTPASSVSSTRSGGSLSGSNSDDDDDDEEVPVAQYSEARPPDGGWGWVVVFASFVINLIADGITFSFGVIYVEFLSYFGESLGKTAWIGSLFMAMPLLSGPIASFLTDRYGCRKVTIVGSVLASLGFVLSAFSTSMEQLYITFGVLAGFGLSLCYVAAVVIVAYYFDKRRSFATGLSVCGSGIGTFIFAPLTQWLIEAYGWRGCTLILAGFFLNMTVCGMLMRDLEWTTHRAKQKAKQRKQRVRLGVSADSFSVSNSTNTGGTSSNLQQQLQQQFQLPFGGAAGAVAAAELYGKALDPALTTKQFSSLITLPTYLRNGEKIPQEVLELLASHGAAPQAMQPTLSHSRSFSEPLSSSRQSNIAIASPPEGALSPSNPERRRFDKTAATSSSTRRSRQIQNERAFMKWLERDGGAGDASGEFPHARRTAAAAQDQKDSTAAYLQDLKMHRHSLTYRGAMLNINRYRLRASSCPDIYRNSMTTIAKEKAQWGQTVDEFKNVFADMLDLSYFADIRFLLFALSNFFLYTWYDVPYVYLTDNARKLGHSETDASMLISYIGIVNMFGEIFLGWCGDRKHMSAGVIYAVCMGLCGIVTACVPLFTTYVGLSVISGLFGLFIAANYALTSIILVELITLDRFTNAYGLLLLVQGIANLVGPPLAGWLTDVTGNYDLAFYLSGFFIAVSGALMFILPVHAKVKQYRELRRQRSDARDAEAAEPAEPAEIGENAATTATGKEPDGGCFGDAESWRESRLGWIGQLFRIFPVKR